jgi:glycosyltransferase involved in cell wall biosynthesis
MLLENNPYPNDTRVRKEAHSLRDAGYEVTVIAPRADGQPDRERVDGIEVERFTLREREPSWHAFLLEYLAANIHLQARTLRQLRAFDVLHLHNPPDTLFPVAFAARLLGRRVVFDQHDLGPELFIEHFGGGRLVRLLRALEWLTYKVAHAVLVVNDSLRTIALTRGKVDETQVFVVRNAPTRAMLDTVPEPRPGALRDPQLVYVGTLGPQDGVDDLPDLMLELRDRHGLPGCHLTIVGDGERRGALRARCESAGLGAAMTFTGYVSSPEVAQLLGQADICLEPARCNEHNDRCSMVKVYEYMAAGRPIVGYRLREVELLGGENIAYAPCNDVPALAAVVARLACDGEERLRRGQALRRHAADRTWEAETESLLAAYASLSQPVGTR